MYSLTVKLFAGFVLFLSMSQFSPAQVSSRAAAIESDREDKARNLTPEKVNNTEATLGYIKDEKILERISAGISGFRLKLGGLVTGGGFALGPEYLRQDLADGEITFRAAAQSSFKSYQKYDIQFTVPSFASDRLFLEVYAVHHRYPGLNYRGPGMDSLEENETAFLLEDTAFDGALGLKPFRYMDAGFTAGYLMMNTGPGNDDGLPSIEQVFTPEQTPGIDRQTDFLRFGAFAKLDYRDNPGGARSGGMYFFQFNDYSDRLLDLHDFRRVDFEIQQYIPFFNKRRVIAFRLKSVLAFHDTGQTVPFYFQPVLGGSNDLRGFQPFRFYDNNLLLMNVEYRWETFSGLDSAIFFDAGKVFPDYSEWDFRNLESSAGFGFRFNVRNNVFLRIDTGFSREGTQIWFKFEDIFAGEPLRYSSPY